MKKNSLISIFTLLCTFTIINTANSQCTTNGATANNSQYSFAIVTGQSFKPTCTAKLNNITFPVVINFSDDFRGTGYFLGIRIKDNSNTILANGIWANGTKQTDQWFPGATNIVADFQCADLTLTNGTTYTWEIYLIVAPLQEPIYLFYTSNNGYADGDYIKDGVLQAGKDLVNWRVNLTTNINNPLAASQAQTDPSSAVATDGAASVTVSGGVIGAPTLYVWKKNGVIISGANGASITNQGMGTYTCEITKGCTITKTFNLQFLSTNQFELNSNLTIFPNPSNETTNISFKNLTNTTVTIMDLNGRILKQQVLKNELSTVNIFDLTNGTYLFKIQSDEGSTTKRIIKN